MPRRRAIIIAAVVIAVIAFLSSYRAMCGVLTDYWWFGSVGYRSVYVRILLTKVVLWCAGFVLAFGATAGGYLLARAMRGPTPVTVLRVGDVTVSTARMQGVVRWAFWVAAALVGLAGGGVAIAAWHRVLLFMNRVPFGVTDPIFGNDVGFYVFTYPLLVFVRSAVKGLVWASLLSAVIYYVLSGAFAAGRLAMVPQRIFLHVTRTLGVLSILTAGGYLLDRYALLYSGQGVAFGAGYADVHARLPACWVMAAASLAVAAAFLTVRSPGRAKPLLITLGVWVGCMILVEGAYPQFVQWALVGPNELRRETPYIEYAISASRAAYGLDKVSEQAYEVAEDLTYEDVTAEELTLRNVRLWDWRPLSETYRQLQAIRTYYDFGNADVDRYDLPQGPTQVQLAVRELHSGKLPAKAQTWVNQRLQYTHGYGLCLSPVNEFTDEGLPELLVRDIPPTTPPGLELTQPRIYYGEATGDYVFVKTVEDEFDYPMGDTNARTRYDGAGGVEVGGLLRRLVLASQFRDIKIILSGELTSESRIMFRRLVRDRVQQVAPFLMLDRDAYPVIHEGRVHWIQDAYTHTFLYPYSQPTRQYRLNYVRNSVKAVVDAYDGTVRFYVSDPDDPLIRAYKSMFPDLFVDLAEMPDGLRSHVRYPLDLFEIQVANYATFHMRDPNVFYNQEDAWAVAKERYHTQEQDVESYYVFMRLPDGDQAEFIVMLPYTPRGRPNMIAWLAARCDAEHYGELLSFHFPKGKMVDGPIQVEGYVDKDPDISRQLTLWGQGGSEVIRGNLLVIPLSGGILYVEPLYIRASGGGMPQLKRVIVGYGKRVAMAETLEGALRELFGKAPAVEVEAPPDEPAPEPPAEEAPAVADRAARLLRDALGHHDRAQDALRAADWEAYGRHMRDMKTKLDELDAALGGPAAP